MYEIQNLNDSSEGAHSGWTQRVVQEGINGKDLLCSATAPQDLELMHWLQGAQKAGPGTAAPLASPLSGIGASAQPHPSQESPTPPLEHSRWSLQKRLPAAASQRQPRVTHSFRSAGNPSSGCSIFSSHPLLLRACSGSAALSLPSPVIPLCITPEQVSAGAPPDFTTK